ncbi:endonuclease-reverse transcriptase domain-containing protein [Hirsutella rhossiliensis]|uniref:Endonuclease-reverse transcriptase domain-containing protein n=1 Tax=Hirsutella rhossiliensis TaxID=111463 RepID=A0A9P8MVV2_9HYPO|nr:endonuclease-reverse transcriptase domain-containing protein [Hirsutella rhossiliensis]KAH0961349.1 endonuclease-reverse transcriptase domain-containing protein [Hirsutella rhossiliensis]
MRFDKTVFLSVVQRQCGDDQAAFRKALGELRLLQLSYGSWKLLSGRVQAKLDDQEVARFADALRVYATKDRVIATNVGPGATAAPDDKAGNLAKQIPVCIGARLMLTSNLWQPVGLCNGARDPPCVIMMEFDKYTGPVFLTTADGKKIVPILPVDRDFLVGATLCTRTQFPLIVCYAITVHKSQSITEDTIVTDLSCRDFQTGLSYVAVSRVKTLQGLMLDAPFDRNHLTYASPPEGIKMKMRGSATSQTTGSHPESVWLLIAIMAEPEVAPPADVGAGLDPTSPSPLTRPTRVMTPSARVQDTLRSLENATARAPKRVSTRTTRVISVGNESERGDEVKSRSNVETAKSMMQRVLEMLAKMGSEMVELKHRVSEQSDTIRKLSATVYKQSTTIQGQEDLIRGLEAQVQESKEEFRLVRESRNADRIKIVCRDEAELQLVKEAAQKTAVEGARIMRDQLYPVRVDNANRTAILDTEGNILPGAIEALSAENRVTIGKISWLSKRESAMLESLRILQLNAHKSDMVQQSLMNDEDLKDFAALAISEPHARNIDGKVVTSPMGHHNWTKMIPTCVRDALWPIRSMLWIRSDLEAEQVPVPSADLTAAVLRLEGREVMVVSVRRTDVVLAGDFNRHDLLWGGDEVSASRQGEGEPIIDLMDDFGLSSLLARGTKTWQRSDEESTIDLVLASAELADELTSCVIHPTEHGSDHRAIQTTFDIRVPERTFPQRLMLKNAPWIAIATRVEDELRPLPWTVGVQTQADQLMRVVTKALRDLTPRAQPPPYAKRWWTKDLTRLRRTYTYWRNQARAQRRAGQSRPDLEQRAKEAAKEYHDNLRRQKKAHWDDFVIEGATSGGLPSI